MLLLRLYLDLVAGLTVYEVLILKNMYRVVVDIRAVVNALWCLAKVCCMFTRDSQHATSFMEALYSLQVCCFC
jgi:hypothetical protein